MFFAMIVFSIACAAMILVGLRDSKPHRKSVREPLTRKHAV
jgi:hypothetical protein